MVIYIALHSMALLYPYTGAFRKELSQGADIFQISHIIMVHYIPLYFHGIPIRIPKFAVMLTSHVKKHIFSGYISFFFYHYIILYPHMNRFFLETNVAGAARAAQCGVPQLQRVTEKPGGGVSNREILNVKI
jgi:hypothetical protein